MHFLTYALAFVVTIGVLVTVHEFGHFITARIFGMHVPVFSVGMGRRLFGFSKLFGFTFGPLKPEQEAQLGVNTDYRLAVLPIGGYAKIEGMIDETQTEVLSPIVNPWEFRAKPWWQKSIVICAGVVMNLLIATLIFTGLALRNGETRQATRTIGYVYPHSVPESAGIRPGDKIVSLGGVKVTDWTAFDDRFFERFIGRDYDIEFETAQGPKVVHYPALDLNTIGAGDDIEVKVRQSLALLPLGYGHGYIDTVVAQPAKSSGLRSGDVITTVNGDSVGDHYSLVSFISAHPRKPIAITWSRDGKTSSTTITPDADGHIGIQITDMPYTGPAEHASYSIFEAVPVGVSMAYRQLGVIVRGIWGVVTGKVPVGKSLGGPIKIFQMAGKSADRGGQTFVFFIAALSLSLAFLNILPIPALDGGHLIIILIEAVIRRELSQKFKLGFQRVGVALLLTLMVFMVFNDIRNL
jgi:regulator of sigma E protease